MKYIGTFLVLSLLTLSGCGGKSTSDASGKYPPLPTLTATCENGFENQTTTPTGDPGDPITALTLWGNWNKAMFLLATEPIPYLNGDTIPPISAAMSFQPHCQPVLAVPDWSDQLLADYTGNQEWVTKNPQPSGAFICDGQPAHACYLKPNIYIVASEQQYPMYEMQNVYLCSIGKCGGR